MHREQKKRFFLSHKKSSALVVSVIVHAAFIAIALTFVAVQVYIKPEQTFEVKDVKRPKMQLKKLQVPVKQQKKTQAPKLRKTIVTKQKMNVDIKMPEIVGIKGGTGYGSDGSLGGLGFGFDMDLFGGSGGKGDEFIGTFYDLKQTANGEMTDIGRRAAEKSFDQGLQYDALKVIKNFVSSGCKPRKLEDYFKAPKLKYATAFMMPPMKADAAPKAFGVEDRVKPSYWLCHYKGQIAAPETGRYRFCGIGDDILIVVIHGKGVVLDACWPAHIGLATSWKGRDKDNRKFSMDANVYGRFQPEVWPQLYREIDERDGYGDDMPWGQAFNEATATIEGVGTPDYMRAACRMVIGDWIDLRKGEAMDVDIIISEIPGGDFCARLLIQQFGQQYAMDNSDAGPRPILPIFKTVPVDPKLLTQMKLDSSEMTAEGPSFSVIKNQK